jgi:hypothetical protein
VNRFTQNGRSKAEIQAVYHRTKATTSRKIPL